MLVKIFGVLIYLFLFYLFRNMYKDFKNNKDGNPPEDEPYNYS